jgi:hypothetical protein
MSRIAIILARERRRRMIPGKRELFHLAGGRSMSRPVCPLLLAGLLVLAASVGVHAANVAAVPSVVGGQGGTVFSTQGWNFTPARKILVGQLGVYDTGGDGLGQAHAVGIWTSGGTLITQVTVPAGTMAPLVSGTRFVDIAGVQLTKGTTYVLGAYYLDSTDNLIFDGSNGTVMSYDPVITPGSGRYDINQFAGLGFPAITTTTRRFGPNFSFTVLADHTWPTDPSPCNNINDLASCINGASDGDVIEIAANAIPAQSVTVGTARSFTLRPADGFNPVFGDFTSFFIPGGSSSVTVLVQGLTLARGTLRAGGGSGPLDITFRGNKIQNVTGFDNGIEVGNRSGPTAFRIENNELAVNPGPFDQTTGISISGLNGGSGRIANNRITQNGGYQTGPIDVANGLGTVSADVIGNVLSGSNFDFGIRIYEFSAGRLNARVINNVVSGQNGNTGAPGAIVVSLSGENSEGDVRILNNTVAYNNTGILIGGRPDLGATGTGIVANNIVAFNTSTGLSIQDFSTISESFNLVFGNAPPEVPVAPGPATLALDPQFVSTTDLHVMPASPALNSGSNALVPADVTTDVAGDPRVMGLVDRGAYEQAAGGTDTDGDGVADIADNCKLVANPLQEDTDADGYGNICDGDFNNDGSVNFADLALFRQRFGTANADADLDSSGGSINFTDLAIFRGLFGKPPGPSGYH